MYRSPEKFTPDQINSARADANHNRLVRHLDDAGVGLAGRVLESIGSGHLRRTPWKEYLELSHQADRATGLVGKRLMSPLEEALLGMQLEHGRQPGARQTHIRRANSAAQELVIRNVRLSYSIAGRYFSRSRVPRGDLEQSGTIGLMIAAKRFDWRRGRRFTTVAYPWVYRSMQEEDAATGYPVPVPTAVYRYLKPVRDMDADELAGYRQRQPRLTPDCAAALANVLKGGVSFERLTEELEGEPPALFSLPSFEEEWLDHEPDPIISQLLSSEDVLSPDERRVIELLRGGADPAEIGELACRATQWVGQRQSSAIQKLRVVAVELGLSDLLPAKDSSIKMCYTRRNCLI